MPIFANKKWYDFQPIRLCYLLYRQFIRKAWHESAGSIWETEAFEHPFRIYHPRIRCPAYFQWSIYYRRVDWLLKRERGTAMIVYHTSYTIVRFPDVRYSRDALDFGKGFYVTCLKQQAIDYADKFRFRGKQAVLNQYGLEDDWESGVNVKQQTKIHFVRKNCRAYGRTSDYTTNEICPSDRRYFPSAAYFSWGGNGQILSLWYIPDDPVWYSRPSLPQRQIPYWWVLPWVEFQMPAIRYRCQIQHI